MAPLLIPVAMELAKFAPSLLKVLTGSDKAAEVAGHVVDIAKTVTGMSEPDEALAVIKADPNKILEFQQAVAAQQIDLEKSYLADIANARAMQIAALSQDDIFSKRFAYYFAAAWSLFTMAYAVGVTFYTPAAAEGRGNAQTVLGFLLGTAVASIFMWLYGSTRGSDQKNKLLAAAGTK